MDERMKESISALMDGEANELEMQRVLSHVDEDLAQTWHRYHQVRQVVRECGPDLSSIDVRSDLAKRLNDDNEVLSVPENGTVSAGNSGQSSVRKRRFSGPAAAIAASAVFAMFFATQAPEWSDVASEATVAAQLNGVSGLEEGVARQPKMHVVFDEGHARRFNEYLLRHAGHSAFGSSQGLMPLARVASVNSVGI